MLLEGSWQRSAGKGLADEVGLRPLSGEIARIVKRTLGPKRYAIALLIQNWGDIMGEQLAMNSIPLKLYFPLHPRDQAVLRVQVRGSYAMKIQYMEPQIIERVNLTLGYSAVARLRLIQKPLDHQMVTGQASNRG